MCLKMFVKLSPSLITFQDIFPLTTCVSNVCTLQSVNENIILKLFIIINTMTNGTYM